MGPNHDSENAVAADRDPFDALDVCHRQTIYALGKLSALITHLSVQGADDESRELAAEILRHFSITARTHHEDEERHLFPKLTATGDAETAQAVQCLRQDHGWLEEDWRELAPQLDAVACGQSWYELDFLREAAAVFTALSRDHIALEESLIYPQARSSMGTGERREMGREMAARRRAARGTS